MIRGQCLKLVRSTLFHSTSLSLKLIYGLLIANFRLLHPLGLELKWSASSRRVNRITKASAMKSFLLIFSLSFIFNTPFFRSSDNTTLLMVEFDNITTSLPEHGDYLKKAAHEFFQTLNNYMQRSTLSLFQMKEQLLIAISMNFGI